MVLIYNHLRADSSPVVRELTEKLFNVEARLLEIQEAHDADDFEKVKKLLERNSWESPVLE
jgi:hypothetical protein